MFFAEQVAYIILIVFVPIIGGGMGWVAGWLMKHTLREDKRKPILDVLMGMVGFLLGAYVSSIGFSLDEKFENGQLVYRKVTGFADHIGLFTVFGAVTLVAATHICITIYKKVAGKSKPF